MKLLCQSFKLEGCTHTIQAAINSAGADLVIVVSGGEVPHVGAIAVSVPRPSIQNPKQVSSSTSIICITGHKEDVLSKYMAATIAASLNRKVILTAGMHWEKVDGTFIASVNKACRDLTDSIIEYLKSG